MACHVSDRVGQGGNDAIGLAVGLVLNPLQEADERMRRRIAAQFDECQRPQVSHLEHEPRAKFSAEIPGAQEGDGRRRRADDHIGPGQALFVQPGQFHCKQEPAEHSPFAVRGGISGRSQREERPVALGRNERVFFDLGRIDEEMMKAAGD